MYSMTIEESWASIDGTLNRTINSSRCLQLIGPAGTDRLQQYVLFSSLPGGHSHSTCRIILYLPSTFLSRSNPSSSSDLGHAMLSRIKSSPPGP